MDYFQLFLKSRRIT